MKSIYLQMSSGTFKKYKNISVFLQTMFTFGFNSQVCVNQFWYFFFFLPQVLFYLSSAVQTFLEMFTSVFSDVYLMLIYFCLSCMKTSILSCSHTQEVIFLWVLVTCICFLQSVHLKIIMLSLQTHCHFKTWNRKKGSN